MNPQDHAYYKLTPDEERAQKKRNIALAFALFAFISFTGLMFFFKMTDTKNKAADPVPSEVTAPQNGAPNE